MEAAFRNSVDSQAAIERRSAARAVAAEIARRWDSGETITESQALADHPLLESELIEELRSARLIRTALLTAQRAGEIPQSLRIMSLAELEAPIEVPENEPSSGAGPVLPRIIGYQLTNLVREGGQATVYRGIQETTGRTVAIKVMTGGSAALSRHRARFEREVQILARLNHGNIVSVIEKGRTADGSFFLAMEYVDGPELDEYCRKYPPTDEVATRKLLRLFIKIAQAVDCAHSHGIVHRDLKPSNIRIDEHGEPKVLDFGFARLLEEDSVAARAVTLSGQIVGSIPWASPEQVTGFSEVTASSDIYSLGIILYQLLTGQFPYAVEGPLHEALSNIANARPLVPSRVSQVRRFGRKHVLDAIVLKALTKDQETRYTSAHELAADLECALDGRRASVGSKRTRRLRYSIAGGFLMVLFSAILGVATRPTPPPVSLLPSVTNSIGMRLVEVPAGRFLLAYPSTTNAHAAKLEELSAFYIGVTEVTQHQYVEVMGINPSDDRWLGPALPVQNVTWNEAVSFCAKLSAKEHRHYRLPTQAEWQYAARGGMGKDIGNAQLAHFAWDQDDSGGQLQPVGQLWPNEYGLYDMHGGVGEWTADDISQSQHPVCGGGFMSAPENCRVESSFLAQPEARLPDVGFRVVLEPDLK